MGGPAVNSPSSEGSGGGSWCSRSEPLRVLHLNAGNMYGGVENLLTTMARFRSVCPEMEPHFGLCYEGRLSRELVAAGSPVHLLGAVRISRPWTVWRARRRLRALLRESRYVVVCHMSWSHAVFGSTVRSVGQKLIFWEHGGHTGQRTWLERLASRTVPDLAISTSNFVASSLAEIFPNTPAKILYCPVPPPDSSDMSLWRAATRSELGAPEGTVVIIQVSRFESWKGHLLHLRALSHIKDNPGWVCWIVGGPQKHGEYQFFEEVRRTAVELGLGDRVRFLGPRSDVLKLLAGADIFCQPNEGPEPFGIVFVEALWSGKPVVTTSMGGALEILNDSCGLLVEPGNSQSLAESLRRLIDSADLRSCLGRNGPARARQLCDPRSQLNMLRKIL